jgi:hypothetical protein
MAYRHSRMPLSRERKARAFWARSFKPKGKMDRLLAETHPNPERSGCPGSGCCSGRPHEDFMKTTLSSPI